MILSPAGRQSSFPDLPQDRMHAAPASIVEPDGKTCQATPALMGDADDGHGGQPEHLRSRPSDMIGSGMRIMGFKA